MCVVPRSTIGEKVRFLFARELLRVGIACFVIQRDLVSFNAATVMMFGALPHSAGNSAAEAAHSTE